MENKLLSAPVSDPSVEVVRTAPQSSPEVDVLAEVGAVIRADLGVLPGQYLSEIQLPHAGE